MRNPDHLFCSALFNAKTNIPLPEFGRRISGASSNGTSKSNGSGPHAVLRDIHLKVPAGSTLAIVGPTGCGKTTLAALIARLWEAPDDSVLIDGHPIRDWPLTTLRQSITEVIRAQSGLVAVPDAPGLGIGLIADGIERFRAG